jgi:hypothetical protein
MSYVMEFLREIYKEEFMDLSVKGQHGDQDIMKNCIVCMMRLTGNNS